jgi:hypothetical protein
MNLPRHAAVLWRFRLVTVAGVVLSLLLAVTASYKVSLAGGPSLVARGASTWASESSLLVTQLGFPEGRVTLPEAPELKTDATGESAPLPKDQLQFADPNRFGALADLYSQLAMSDRVRLRTPEKARPPQVSAGALQGASGGVILPVIKLTTTAASQSGAQALNQHMVDALRGTLEEDQKKNQIPSKQRVSLVTLNAPSAGYLMSGPSKTGSLLALVLGLLGTVAFTHLLAAVRSGGGKQDDDAIEGIVDPWADANDQPAPDPQPASVWGGPAVPPVPPAPPQPRRARGVRPGQ